MYELTSRIERAVLLPGGSRGLFAVLFWRSSDSRSAAARRRFADISTPANFRAVAVDLDAAPEIVSWFGLSTCPMLGVVTDGAMLAMEFDCSAEGCRTLFAHGLEQYSMMRSMSS